MSSTTLLGRPSMKNSMSLVPEVVACDSSKAFKVVGVLVNFRPFQAESFQFRSGTLLSLGVLVLGREFCEELFQTAGCRQLVGARRSTLP